MLHILVHLPALRALADWGTSPFQSLGACVAAAAKSTKAKTAAVALVDSPLAGGWEAEEASALDTQMPPLTAARLMGTHVMSAAQGMQHASVLAGWCDWPSEAPAHYAAPPRLQMRTRLPPPARWPTAC